MTDEERQNEGGPEATWPGWGASWPPPPGEGYPYGPPHRGYGPSHGGYGEGYGPGPAGGWGGGWASVPPPPPGYPGHPGYPGYPGYPSPPSRRRRLPALLTALLVLLAAGLGVGVGHAVWRNYEIRNAGGTNPSGGNGGFGFVVPPFGSGGSPGGSASGNGAPADVGAIAAKVAPDLVDINVTFSYQRAAGAGTGIVLSPNGEVITNNHVINGATKISVTDVGNHKTYNASVVGYDSTHDVAVLQLQGASGLRAAKVNTSPVSIGQAVVAVGNAGGQGGQPISAGGSVTGVNQSITASDQLDGTSEQLSGLIQVNADIQSGDSGGSLVNVSGQVIGLDTAASESFSFSQSGSEGFAIPIAQALSVARQIKAGNGSSTVHVGPTAFLGVLVSSSALPGGQGGIFGGGNAGNSTTPGADVSNVVPGGPAAQAGITGGDVITSFDGQPVDSSSSLTKLLVPHHPGDRVSVDWVDSSGQAHSATVTLASGPPA